MLIIKGFVIGASMLVPGLSGGSCAMMLGLYDKIIISSAEIFKDFKHNASFLFKLFIGALLALMLFSKLILPHIDQDSLTLKYIALVITLISVPLFLKSEGVNIKSVRNVVFFVAASLLYLMAAFVLGKCHFSDAFFVSSPISVFVSGIILSAALVLPGISFSYMLLYMGLYEKTLDAVSSFDMGYLMPFSLGMIFGTVLFILAFKKLLKTYKEEFALSIAAFLLTSLIV